MASFLFIVMTTVSGQPEADATPAATFTNVTEQFYPSHTLLKKKSVKANVTLGVSE